MPGNCEMVITVLLRAKILIYPYNAKLGELDFVN
jgi:hypothetical protein